MPAKKKVAKKKSYARRRKEALKPDFEVFDPGIIPEDGSQHFDDTGVALPSFRPPTITGRPVKFDNVDALKRQVDMYFAFCDPHLENVKTPVLMKDGQYKIVETPQMTKQRPYTISGLAYFLYTCRDTLLEYEHLADKDPDQIPVHLRHEKRETLIQFSDTIKRAKQRVHSFVEEKLLGGGHPAGPIFNLKNNFTNWKDQTEVVNPQETENRKAIDELREIVVKRVGSVKRKKQP